MLVTSAGCSGTSVRLCLDHRLSRACWSWRSCLFLHFNLCTRLRLEDGTSFWGTDLKTLKNSSLSLCWCWFFLLWLAIFQSGSPGWAQLASPSVWSCIWPPLPSSVGCGFAVCWWDDASLCWWDLTKTSRQSESRKKETPISGRPHAFKPRHCLPACSLAARVCSNSIRNISYSFLTWASVSSSWNTSVRTFLCSATSSFCIEAGKKWAKEKIWQ